LSRKSNVEMAWVEPEFLRRASWIPPHGLGLSVDVYSPNLFELVDVLSAHYLSFEYLEVFQVQEGALRTIKSHLPPTRWECHAEGLWVTQPDWRKGYPKQAAVQETAIHLKTLGCSWFNQECASKQMAGYAFGTYVPPLFTVASAEVTARNARGLQAEMDAWCAPVLDSPPLLLLETPPLTYFGMGDLAYAEFFRVLTNQAPCGLVLDIGHVWTVYRYTGGWRTQSPREFFAEFLEVFPLSRVIQIHLAGLARHPEDGNHHQHSSVAPPAWLDAHGAPIPDVLFDMLDLVLAHPGLTNLKGVAMEVDTKPIPLIVEEYRRFTNRYGWWHPKPNHQGFGKSSVYLPEGVGEAKSAGFECSAGESLLSEYREYVQAIRGPAANEMSAPNLYEDSEVDRYRHQYLPREIVEWGGDLQQMFPRTLGKLRARGIPVSKFVDFWFAQPRPNPERFDFFLMKIQRFLEFVEVEVPGIVDVANQEAGDLRRGYKWANQIMTY